MPSQTTDMEAASTAIESCTTDKNKANSNPLQPGITINFQSIITPADTIHLSSAPVRHCMFWQHCAMAHIKRQTKRETYDLTLLSSFLPFSAGANKLNRNGRSSDLSLFGAFPGVTQWQRVPNILGTHSSGNCCRFSLHSLLIPTP